MRLDGIRISLRLHRFELYAFGVALIGLSIAGFVASLYVTSLKPGPECFGPGEMPLACGRALDVFNNAAQWLGGLLLAPLLLTSLAVGLFLGVVIVGRELERGTVRLAWSLAPSRWRWYLVRVLPVLVAVAALTFLAGIALDQFASATRPGEDLSKSFELFGARGGLLAARAVLIFGIAVAVGSVIGRALPSVIIAALVSTIVLTGVINLHREVLKGEAVIVPVDQTGEGGGYHAGDMFIDSKFVLEDGTLVGWEYFGDQGPPYDEQGVPLHPQVSLVIPGERYRFVEAREALALGAMALLALLFAAAVVQRRRPG